MDLPAKEAAALNSRYCNYGDGDSLRYINRRRQVERWLLERARAVGIKPEDDIPLHFLITSEKLPDPPIRGGAVLSFQAECLPIHLVSFTFDDGFYNYAREVERATLRIQHPLHGQVLEPRRLAAALRKYGWLPSRMPDGRYPRYIEAHLWTRRVSDFTGPD